MPNQRPLNGRRVFWYSNEHDPAHVHVESGGCEAKFELNCPDGPVECVKIYKPPMPSHEVRKIEKELEPRIAELCQSWKDRP